MLVGDMPLRLEELKYQPEEAGSEVVITAACTDNYDEPVNLVLTEAEFTVLVSSYMEMKEKYLKQKYGPLYNFLKGIASSGLADRTMFVDENTSEEEFKKFLKSLG